MDFSTNLGGDLPRDGLGEPWIRVEDKSLPAPIYLRLGVDKDGRLACTGLLIDGDPDRELPARELRSIRLPKLLSEFQKHMTRASGMKQLIWELHRIRYEGPSSESGWRMILSIPARQRLVQRGRPGPKGYPDDHYRKVARAYKVAKRKHPTRPIRALMQEFNATEPTIHRWLRTARDKGFITTKKED